MNTAQIKKWGLGFCRIVIGFIFFTAGATKLLNPTDVFEIAVNYYEVVPQLFVHSIAITLPWVEMILGGYLILGLWTAFICYFFIGLTFSFQLLLGQAIVRKLPIEQCGCIGEKFGHFSLYQSFMLDTVILLGLIYIATTDQQSFAIDSLFTRKS